MQRRFTKFGEKVRTKMLLHGITTTWLAERVGYSRTYIHDILRGKRESKEIESKIAQLLDISV